MKFHRNIQGILPPYLLLELALRNPDELQFLDTLAKTQALFSRSRARGNTLFHFSPEAIGEGNGEREVYDCQAGTNRPGKRFRFEGESAGHDEEGNEAYEYTGIVRDYYRKNHGRVSIDAHGMKMVSCFNYDEDYNNAFWDGSMMTYGRPKNKIFKKFVLLDVCGHEITHGITEFVSGMEYYGQSGALNEHCSDVFGELIEQFHLKIAADKADWVIGNGIFHPGVKGTGIRNMLNPGTAYNDPALGKDPQPAHMKDYKRMSGDNGGVHYNSGIPNRAFALFALAVGGNAWERAGKIWYAARSTAGSKPSFAQFASHTLDACKTLGHDSVLSKLKEAWIDGVGVTPSKTALDTDTPAPGGEGDDDGDALPRVRVA